MIIPDPSVNPLFRDDGRPFQDKMIAYIRDHFSDLLGSDAALLDLDNGLDLIANKYGFDRSGTSRAA